MCQIGVAPYRSYDFGREGDDPGMVIEEGMSKDGQRALLGSETPRPCRGALSRAVPFFLRTLVRASHAPCPASSFPQCSPGRGAILDGGEKYVFSLIDKKAFAPHSDNAVCAICSLKWIGLKAHRGGENRVMREQLPTGIPVSPFFVIQGLLYLNVTTPRAAS